MKILFDTNLSFRGTTTAVIDYAKYNQELLNNESFISFKQSEIINEDYSRKSELSNYFKKNYKTIEYSDFNEINSFVEENSIDYFYSLKMGFIDVNIVKSCQNLVHCVFQYFQPHGDKYVYVSEWLTNEMTNGVYPFVPHIVMLPEYPIKDIRKELNISPNKIVIGRYGGIDQFDLHFVKDAIEYIVNVNSNIVFVFVNTFKFIEHSNVIFLNSIITPQDKTDFILSCDAMVHGRVMGESFGLSIYEFLFHNRPVFAWNNGKDKNHIELLQKFNTLYENKYDLINKINNFCCGEFNSYNYKEMVTQFQPEIVMNKFKQVFL